jgi:hypothetical protein
MAREGVPLIVIQRQLGHTNLGITSIYLQGIDSAESSTPSAPAARQWCRSTARCGRERGAPLLVVVQGAGDAATTPTTGSASMHQQ